MQSAGSAFDKAAYDLPLKPLYEISGDGGGSSSSLEAAKQRFKRKKGERAEAARLEPEERQGNEEIEHKLSVVEDQKEAKRLKRLLRNRVSAQQARERKKSYVSTIEEKVHDQDSQLAQMRQRVQTLERENGMLRQLIMCVVFLSYPL
ncbi:hypothetical protein WJX79_001445 [Trebouxia sp. C0005]